MKSYEAKDTFKIGKAAVAAVTDFLLGLDHTKSVENVEGLEKYRERGIDLIWEKDTGETLTIEVKGDTIGHSTGNFFFEVVSNQDRNTPGCFVYTEADVLLYYFLVTKSLWLLPMPDTRDWFLENINDFTERETSTAVGDDHYVTQGRLVPTQRVLEEVDDVWGFRL